MSVSSLKSVAIDTDPLESVSELWPESSAEGVWYVLGLKPGLSHMHINIIYDWTFNESRV